MEESSKHNRFSVAMFDYQRLRPRGFVPTLMCTMLARQMGPRENWSKAMPGWASYMHRLFESENHGNYQVMTDPYIIEPHRKLRSIQNRQIRTTPHGSFCHGFWGQFRHLVGRYQSQIGGTLHGPVFNGDIWGYNEQQIRVSKTGPCLGHASCAHHGKGVTAKSSDIQMYFSENTSHSWWYFGVSKVHV